MTVIAFRGGVFASDMRFAVNSVIGMPGTKIVRANFTAKKKRIDFVGANFGTAIDSSLVIDIVKQFLTNPVKYVKAAAALPDDGHIAGVSYTDGDETYRVFLIHDKGAYFYDPLPEFVAWGAGDESAMAAFHMGASAQKAAQIACVTNSDCGGPVQHVDLTRDPSEWAIEGGTPASFNRLIKKSR